MQKLQFVEYFDYPRELVFETMRDKIEKYIKYAPNIKYAKVIEKKQIDKNVLKMRMEWMGHGQIPLVVRPILKPDMIKWRDEAIWDEKNWTCSWEITPFYFKEFVECRGVWNYIEEKNRTKMQLDGIFKVYIPSFPGVPDKVAQSAGGMIEKFIMKYLEPNMKSTMKAVKKFLEEECT